MADLQYWDAEYVASSRADEFLKTISVAADQDGGNVEAPTGWFAIMDINSDDVAAYVSRFGDPWISDDRNFATGWYAIVVDNNGIVFGFFYGTSEKAKAKAQANFETAEAAHARWDLCVDLNQGEEVMLVNNLNEIRAEAKYLTELVHLHEPLDTGEGGRVWDLIGVIAGDLANVAGFLWPDGGGPIE